MKLRLSLLVFLSLLWLNILLAQKPNIVVLLADDLGYGDLSCYGCPDIQTPNIDKLASQGARFTNFYANAPECTPTRAAFMSGRYQQRIGGLECAIGAGNVGRYGEAEWLASQNNLGLPPEQCTLPLTLKKAGYNTAVIGKWHLGYEEKFRPNNQGFDYSFGPIGYGGDYFYHTEQVSINQSDFSEGHNLAQDGKEIFRESKYMTNLIANEAIEWIEQQSKNKPFFLYIPFTAPHSPYQGPNDNTGRPLMGEEWSFKSREKYVEMVESMDHKIGEILEALDTKGFNDETIIVFFSDNGANQVGNNGVLSGFKGNVYEGGIRVPCIIRWPEKIEAGFISDQVSISMDLSCSLIKLSGEKVAKCDGIDIIGHISGQKPDFDRVLYWRAKRGNIVRKAVREDNLKYLAIYNQNIIKEEKLFNLKDDPSEKIDLSLDNPDKIIRLRNLIKNWEDEVKAERLVKCNKTD